MNLNIEAATLDGYTIEQHGNRFWLVHAEGKHGPHTSEVDAWTRGGAPDYTGNRIIALDFATRKGYTVRDASLSTPEIIQAVIDHLKPKRKRSKKSAS